MSQPGYDGSPHPSPHRQESYPPLEGYDQAQPGYSFPQGYAQPGYPPPPQQGYETTPGYNGAPQPQQQGRYPPPQAYDPAQPGYPPPQQGYETTPQQGYGAAPQQRYAEQPQGQQDGAWMQAPTGVPECPPGLEYLTQIDQILFHRQQLENSTGFEKGNKFEINLGQKVYFAEEQSDRCSRHCCRTVRKFEIKILDDHQQQIVHLERPPRCASCCTPCCLQQIMTITSPPGTVMGSIKQTWDICLPKFDVKNEHGDTVLKITGPCFSCNFSADTEFKVETNQGIEIGKILKHYIGPAKEDFRVLFPMDLDVKIKACLLGAVCLIEVLFEPVDGMHG